MFGVILLSLVVTAFTSSLYNRAGHHTALINCPTCEHHVCDVNNLMQCEVCQIDVPHHGQPPQNVKCAQAGHCHEDHRTLCCENQGCVESIFGHFGTTAVSNPPATLAASNVGCPTCEKRECDFINRDQCFMCKFDLHDGQLPHVHCLKENENCDPTHHNTLCCSDEQCIAQAFGHYYPTSHSVTSTTTAAATNLPTTSSTSLDTTPPPTSSVPGPSSSSSSPITDENTSTDSVSSTIFSTTDAINSSTTSTTTDLNPYPSSASLSTNTTISATSQGHANCSDEIQNCALWKSYGVCHALQEQTSMYALAVQCKATCNLCTGSP